MSLLSEMVARSSSCDNMLCKSEQTQLIYNEFSDNIFYTKHLVSFLAVGPDPETDTDRQCLKPSSAPSTNS